MITIQEIDYLKSDKQRNNTYVTALPPIFIWLAQINDGSIGKGETTITFDGGITGGSGLSFSDIEADQTLWIGTAAYLNNICKLRIKSISSGDGGVTGTVTVAGHSYDLENDQYIAFIHTYEPHCRFSYIDMSEVFYKDDDITYAMSSNANTQPDPIVIGHCHQAKFIDDSLGYAQFDVDLSESYPVAQGASITQYSLDVVPTPATTSFDTGTGLGYVRCDTANYYWAKFGAQDSNGKWGYTYRLLAAHSTDPTENMYPIEDFQINSITGQWEGGSWNASIEFFANTEFGDAYDGTIVIVWGDFWWWNETTHEFDEVNINSLSDISSNVIYVGYLSQQNIQSNTEDGGHSNVFDLLQITDLMRLMPTYSWPLEAAGTVDEWWKYAAWLTVGRGILFMLQWNANIPLVTDCIGFTSDAVNIYRKYIEFSQGSLYESCNNIAETYGSRSKLISDRGNRLHITENIQLLSDSERSSASVFSHIYDDYLGEQPIEIVRQSLEQVSQVYTSGFTYDGALGEPQPVYAIAPGTKPTKGAPPINHEKQTFENQQDANDTAGRFWAINNNKYLEVRFNFSSNLLPVLEVATQNWWTFSITTDDNIRDLVWSNKKLVLRSVEAEFIYGESYEGHTAVSCVFEVEADPMQGIPWFYEEDLPEEEEPPPVSQTTINGTLYTGSSVHFLNENSSSWEQKTLDSVNDLEADYFWRQKQGSLEYDDAILAYAGEGVIKRTDDGGATWNSQSLGTPPNDFGDSPAPGAGDLSYIMLECNTEYSDEFVFIARWQNSGGTWRSWILKTSDDFSSFDWLQMS